MPFAIIRNDITKVAADAIVNSANPAPICGTGADLAIYHAAGYDALLAERRKIGTLAPGEVAVTPAFNLKAKFILHTVGPVWQDGYHGELETLTACYRNTLKEAQKLGCKSVAYPLISTGVYRFPKDQALQVAMKELQRYADLHEIDIYLVVFDSASYEFSGSLYKAIESFVDANYVAKAHVEEYGLPDGAAILQKSKFVSRPSVFEMELPDLPLEKTFQEKLLAHINASGLSNSAIYKPMQISRQSFSKIVSDRNYQPSKSTALLFCISLKLDLADTMDLLSRAGFTLSPSSKTDMIIKACIKSNLYDLNEIELILYKHSCPELRRY